MIRAVYVAGPIKADTLEGIRLNCARAAEVAYQLSRAGFAVVCVHPLAWFEISMSGEEVEADRHEQVLEQDLELLARCDAVVLVTEDYLGSAGTCREVRAARSLGIPVLTLEQALAWGSETAA